MEADQDTPTPFRTFSTKSQNRKFPEPPNHEDEDVKVEKLKVIGMNQVTSEWLRSQSSSCVQPKFIPPELFGRVTSRKNDIKIGTSLPIGGKAKATIKILCRWNSGNQNVHSLPGKFTTDNIFTNMGSRKTDYRLTNGKYMCMR